MTIVPEGINLEAIKDSIEELTSAMLSPLVTGLSIVTEYKLGEKDQYLSSILTVEDIDKLKWGSSIAVFSPTGAGKSWTIEKISLAIAKNKKVIILTNRRVCKEQLIQELSKKAGLILIPSELLDNINITDNLEIMTYQQFVRISHRYHGKEFVLFLDECHCFTEDSTFSVYPQQMINFLKGNLDNTKRIYLTATPDDILSIIWDIEALSDKKLYPLTKDNFKEFLRNTPVSGNTRIRRTYIMKSDWSYLNFQAYAPDKKDDLAEYINKSCSNGKKTLVFINDIEGGSDLKEQLGNCQHIYSDEDKKAELHEIAVNEKFTSEALITTKVAENGLSLHDDKLSLIVSETYDLTVLQQVIGRARVNRRNPREITVLIPDYSLSQLGSIKGKLYIQLSDFMKVAKNPDFSMQYLPQPNPCIYYDAILKRPVVNDICK